MSHLEIFLAGHFRRRSCYPSRRICLASWATKIEDTRLFDILSDETSMTPIISTQIIWSSHIKTFEHGVSITTSPCLAAFVALGNTPSVNSARYVVWKRQDAKPSEALLHGKDGFSPHLLWSVIIGKYDDRRFPHWGDQTPLAIPTLQISNPSPPNGLDKSWQLERCWENSLESPLQIAPASKK